MPKNTRRSLPDERRRYGGAEGAAARLSVSVAVAGRPGVGTRAGRAAAASSRHAAEWRTGGCGPRCGVTLIAVDSSSEASRRTTAEAGRPARAAGGAALAWPVRGREKG
eukprot:366476-Chlamydomonas_euryale.AAC.17